GIIIPRTTLAAQVIFTDITCGQACTGKATVTAGGGVIPYTYNWSGGAGTTSSVAGLCAGSYDVTVTDSLGCDTVLTGIVIGRTTLAASVQTTQITCGQACTGIASVTASG